MCRGGGEISHKIMEPPLTNLDPPLTAPFNNMRTLKLQAQPTNAFFRYRQSNVRLLLPASDHGQAHGNQRSRQTLN